MDEQQQESLVTLQRLVEAFAAHETDYISSTTYNETQARTDFISPFLASLGWDVYNRKRLSPSLREVAEEANVTIADDAPSRRPDYELRQARIRKMFVEAKKPSVNLDQDAAAAFQARRYGYSAGMPIVALTNFRQLAIFDCTVPPSATDNARVARVTFFHYQDYERRFAELWDYLSRDVMYSGRFDERYTHELFVRGSAPFDELFLDQVRRWRYILAIDIQQAVPALSTTELAYAVQLFLSRLIFLRICEDRNLERYEQLRDAAGAGGGFAPFRELLEKADQFYDSRLFDMTTDAGLGISVSDQTLAAIVDELYYPRSPYTFSVVQAEVLGRIYEQFLGEEITVQGGAVRVVERPEVKESGGVIPTPRDVVDEIVDRTLRPLIHDRPISDLETLTVLDICCGSGVFLLSAYERLCEQYLNFYVENGTEHHHGKEIMEVTTNVWRLTFEEKRRILLRHIRGVDIDPEAVEVAQLSLLLKLLEDESQTDLRAFVQSSGEAALPDLSDHLRSGNSLVDRRSWEAVMGPLDDATERLVRPFQWATEFPHESRRGGFDAIIGNPPYIRIQNMAKYSPEEVKYYGEPDSPYNTAHQGNFDKYALFIERALNLVTEEGRLGLITPHKFMSSTAGRAVRELLCDRISEVVHFGSQLVFPRTSNYTAIIIAGPVTSSSLVVESVVSIAAWRRGVRLPEMEVARDALSGEPWQFAAKEFTNLRDRLRASGCRPLRTVADIFVGLQTSADNVYIVQAQTVTERTIAIEWNGQRWELERGILRPFLHDVPIEDFRQPKPNKWIIFPYTVDGKTAHLIQPDSMEAEFPGCWAYLQARRGELDDRNVTGGIASERQWYQYGRSQSLTKFDGPKIILPILSTGARYALDERDIRVTGGGNGPYYLVRSKNAAAPNELLLAVLNHPLAESGVRLHTSVFRGGYYSHGRQFIEDVLVPSVSEEERDQVVRSVREVISARTTVFTARTPGEQALARRRYEGLREGLMQLVDQLFALTSPDLEIIASVPSP